jgi:hypothetical protein
MPSMTGEVKPPAGKAGLDGTMAGMNGKGGIQPVTKVLTGPADSDRKQLA